MNVQSQMDPMMTLTIVRPSAEVDPRDAILSLARTAFAEKGFDGASMQDLARAAGMSAGNFYRYFPSKAAIVQAFVARETVLIDAGFALIADAPDPVHAIHNLIRSRISGETLPDCALWAEIVAVAHRQPDIAQAILAMEKAVVARLTRLFAQLTHLHEAEAQMRFEPRVRLMVLLVRGIEMEALTCQEPDSALTELVISEVTRLVTQILSEA